MALQFFSGFALASVGEHATLYRMMTDDHVGQFGLKARDLLQRKVVVKDRPLTSRAEIDDFQTEHNVPTTSQIFIGGERIGGYDALLEHLGKPVQRSKARLAAAGPAWHVGPAATF